jgi:hypothetical protein
MQKRGPELRGAHQAAGYHLTLAATVTDRGTTALSQLYIGPPQVCARHLCIDMIPD